ncbi:MAG: IS21 family transposase, partial [Xanthomonadales bacterium]|nr:IS21 family transposase [Xanthomonadales bacterium]
GMEQKMLLRHYLEQGLSKSAIARRLGVSRRTLHHWIGTGQLDRDLDRGEVCYGPRPPVVSKLDPYRELVTARLASYPKLTATRLFEEIKAAGYDGGYSLLKAFVRQVRPTAPIEPVVRFETAPGLQAQVDFAHFSLPWGVRYALVVVLGYSRLLWLKYYPRQTLAVLMAGLEEAFAVFGGVPAELLFDQMKAVVIDDERRNGGRLLENPQFARFANHWGFRIRACRPYRAQTKGKVERPISYVRQSFFYGRDFVSDDDLNAQAGLWLQATANQRRHRSIGEAPNLRFERDERTQLRPLAVATYRPPHAIQAPPAVAIRPPWPKVEQRALTVYDQLLESRA